MVQAIGQRVDNKVCDTGAARSHLKSLLTASRDRKRQAFIAAAHFQPELRVWEFSACGCRGF